MEPPVINSISMDKKTATNGDYVNITFNTSGDILEGMIEVHYTAPAGNATKAALLSAELGAGGKYSGPTIIGPNDATGVWKVSYIILYDKAYNEIKIYNSKGNLNSVDGILQDLSAADLEVKGTIPDITPPELKNISVQNRTVIIEASDDISGMTWITVVYKAPKGNAIKYVYCQKNAEGKYISQPIEIGLNDAIGK